jgi:hypothetical protein
LVKDKYSIFTMHPDNLIPTCDTCNKKAKLTKNLLVRKSVGQPDQRRLCFFPFVENCAKYVGIRVEQGDLRLEARFLMDGNEPVLQEKLVTWNEVYCMQGRVEGKFSDLAVIAESDCHANNLEEFRRKIREKADTYKKHCRLEAWFFWKYRLYEWLHNNGNGVIDALWNSILAKRADDDAADVYGI